MSNSNLSLSLTTTPPVDYLSLSHLSNISNLPNLSNLSTSLSASSTTSSSSSSSSSLFDSYYKMAGNSNGVTAQQDHYDSNTTIPMITDSPMDATKLHSSLSSHDNHDDSIDNDNDNENENVTQNLKLTSQTQTTIGFQRQYVNQQTLQGTIYY